MVRDPESGAGADRAMSNRTPAGFTHAAPVRRHIAFLMESGLSREAICAASGIAHTSLHGIARGEASYCRRETAEAILGVTVADRPAGRRVDAQEPHLLLEVVHRYGYRWDDVRAMLGLRPQRCRRNPLHGRRSVDYRTYLRVVTLYRLLVRAGRVPPLMDIERAERAS